MMRRLLLACVVLCLAGRSDAQTVFLIDNFDDAPDARVTGRTITPDQATFASGGDMFGPAERGSLLSNGQTMPFAISDDSVVGAAGNSVFQFDILGLFGQAKADTDGFFGVADLANPNNLAGTGVVDWTINTSGLTNLSLTVDVGAMGDFEATGNATSPADIYKFSVSFNGGATFTPVMIFAADESIRHIYREMDALLPADADFDLNETVDAVDFGTWSTNFGTFSASPVPGREVGNTNGDSDVDGGDLLTWQRQFGQIGGARRTPFYDDPLKFLGADGVLGGSDDVILDKSNRLTGALDTFTANISGVGDTMILRFEASNDGADEAFGFDNLKLTGTQIFVAGAVPEPGSLWLVGCGAAALAVGRRRGR